MADFCTCGAELVPDSLFCHRCGKQQREIAGYEPEVEAEPVAAEVVPPPVAAVEAAPPPVNFHNRLAIQIGLVMAILATLASFLVYFNWLAAGFFTVLVYRRRTGYPMDTRAGVRLGWITGILMFVIMTVILTGAVQGIIEVGRFGALLDTAFGRAVLIKIVVALGIIATIRLVDIPLRTTNRAAPAEG